MPRSQGSPQRPHPRRIGSHALSPPPECAHSCFASSYIRQHQHPAAKWYPPPTRSKVRTYLINSCVPVLFPPGRTKSGAAQFSSMLPQFHNPLQRDAVCSVSHTHSHAPYPDGYNNTPHDWTSVGRIAHHITITKAVTPALRAGCHGKTLSHL